MKAEPKPVDGGEDAPALNISAERLRSLIERIERLETEKKALAEDIREIYIEGKSAGFCPKTMRQLVAIRRKDPQEVEEAEHLMATYKRALGMA